MIGQTSQVFLTYGQEIVPIILIEKWKMHLESREIKESKRFYPRARRLPMGFAPATIQAAAS